MKVTGIIVEYNPFHNGHALHIQKTREITNCDVLIAVMSGNYVQRGEMAILDKWTRSKHAIMQGVDIVLELPYIVATQSANQFAQGAMDILHLAKADSFVFGSESNNLDNLKELSTLPLSVDNLKESLKTGNSFPKSYGYLEKEIPPNDILGIAYLKANKNLTPYTIQRNVSYHDDCLYESISSATAIRKAVFSNQTITSTSMKKELLEGPCQSWSLYYPLLRHLLLTLPKETVQGIFLVSEGIENHLYNVAMEADNFATFINKATTRRYTSSRIQRVCLQIINHVTKQEVKQLPPYDTLRVLASNQIGINYLKHLKQQEVKIASKFSQLPQAYRDLEFRTTLTYASVLESEQRKKLIQQEISGPIILKEN